MIEAGYSCEHYAVPPYPCGVSEDWCMPVCGDGLLVGSEVWDGRGTATTGTRQSGDGCSGGCQVECGYTCGESRDACETVCGDGLRGGVGGVRRRELGGRGRMQLDVRGGGGMDVLGGDLREVMVQHGVRGRRASGERGVRRREPGHV